MTAGSSGRLILTQAVKGPRLYDTLLALTRSNGKYCFSSTSSSDGGDNKDKNKNSDHDNDPYGVNYKDGEEGLGPEEYLPPRYIRDPATGTMTGQTERELSTHDKYLLTMTKEERLRVLKRQVEESLSKQEKQDALVDRVLNYEAEKARAIRENHPDRKEWERLKKKYYKLLQKKEKQMEEIFQKKKRRPMTAQEQEYHKLLDTHELHDGQVDEDDDNDEFSMDFMKSKKKTDTIEIDDAMAHPDHHPSNPWKKENLAWVAQDVNLYQDELLMPPELTRAKKLNREVATPLPKNVLHHNNLDLLRRYVTPGGQIKNRVQSRLGAKDQRKIAKIVKRARAIGLIPYVGQWKVKDDGDLFDPTLNSKKDWELVFERAGLLGKYKMELTEEEKDALLRKGRALGIVSEEGKIALADEMKKIEKKLMDLQVLDKAESKEGA